MKQHETTSNSMKLYETARLKVLKIINTVAQQYRASNDLRYTLIPLFRSISFKRGLALLYSVSL